MKFDEKRVYKIKIYDNNDTPLTVRNIILPVVPNYNNPEKIFQLWKEYFKKYSDEDKIYFLKENGTFTVIMKDKITGISVEENSIKTPKGR